MPPIQRIPSDGYLIPSKLVYWAITSIIGGIVVIGGYMVIWAVSDASWKAALMLKVQALEVNLATLQSRIDVGILPRTDERLRHLQTEIDGLDRRTEKLEESHSNGHKEK